MKYESHADQQLPCHKRYRFLSKFLLYKEIELSSEILISRYDKKYYIINS